jgi:carbamoyltransferase
LEGARLGFHWPASVRLHGREIPAAVFSHHFAHAAYAFYESGLTEGAILSHDGGQPNGIESGLFCFGSGRKLWALTPHHLAVGALYDGIAERLGLGTIGGAGKLMGLSSYGHARFYHPSFAGNWIEMGKPAVGKYDEAFFHHCLESARSMGYDLGPLGDPARATAAVNADIAASTQRVFEETIFRAVRALGVMLDRMGRNTSNLCITGGTALNCPANTRLRNESRFTHVSVAPGCGDSGLAIGSALALYHNVFDEPRVNLGAGPDAYLGLRGSAEISGSQLRSINGAVEVRELDDAATDAAKMLADNFVVAWFDGRSELGPRALGHRSILADPRHIENWARVNRIKGREPWRPFAPIVLEEKAHVWYGDAPIPSLFMLFNARCRSNRVPAVTHVDGSARIQTVTRATGSVHGVLTRFFELTGVPILMNTSFNGPGEPIIETPEQALSFLLSSGLDAVYFGSYCCTRRVSSAVTDCRQSMASK